MRATRRENISTVAGYTVWRQRSKLLLTPHSVRMEMIRGRRLQLTALDQPKTQRWEVGARGAASPMDFTLINDDLMPRLARHGCSKRCLDDYTLEILSAFTAMQNRTEGALAPAQYGLIYCPHVQNKSRGFLGLIVQAAKGIGGHVILRSC